MKQGKYTISVAARLLETHPQTLRLYERLGLISPERSKGNIRLYSDEDVDRVRQIQHFTQDLGVNLAGVDMFLRLLDRVHELEQEIASLRANLKTASTPHTPPPPRRLFELPRASELES